MSVAVFRLHGELEAFLAPEHRGRAFRYRCARAANLKNAIEALGVPHTEVGALRVNGEPATLQRTVRDGDEVEVHPRGPETASEPLFLADAHLGGLARFLRMLGFDTLHDNGFTDQTIRQIASQERRIVLTRDRELLKCREIGRGCYVHAIRPEAQLREVACRYRLAESARPFSLCLLCNVPLEAVARSAVAARLPPKVLEEQAEFRRCPGCGRVYWPGSHYRRMRRALEQTTGLAPQR